MFALPFQSSRADKRKSAGASSSASSQDRDSLQDATTSPTSDRSIASGVSAAVHALSPSRLRLEHPKSGASTYNPEDKGKAPILPPGFGESPRAAPTPPVRRGSTAPPKGWWSHSKSPVTPPASASTTTSKFSTSPTTPKQSPVVVEPATPPPIPAKSPKRQKSKTPRDAADIFRSLEDDPFGGGGSRASSRSKRKNKDKDKVKKGSPVKQAETIVEEPKQPERSFTVPVEAQPKSMAIDMAIRTLRARAKSATTDERVQVEPSSTASAMRTKLAGVRGGRVDKSIKRLSTGSTIRAEGLDLDDLSTFLLSTTPPSKGEEQTKQPLQGRRQRQGETLSMLVRSGFFPGGAVEGKTGDGGKTNLPAPLPLAVLDKALPPTPTSIVETPTELYHDKPIRPLRLTVRNVRKPPSKRRSPLSQVPTTNSRRNNSKSFPPLSRLRLPAILESLPPSSENTPPQSGATTPIATQIHLRGGSVVTVCPPELTAWQRSVYLQGPIKLPKPVIVPSKNSVASLEPFQEAIDQVYQEALSIPRRRSDEQAVDDVCGFFDDFGFEEIGFEGDRFDVICFGQDYLGEEGDGITDFDIERFSTPPMEPEVTPVETVLAKGIMGTKTQPLPLLAPPLNTAETLRARGIARLIAQRGAPTTTSGARRKDSHTLTLSHEDGGQHLQLLPVPEDSMLEAVLEPSRNDGASSSSLLTAKPGDRNSSGSDSIEEMDGSSSWIAPLFPRKLTGAVQARPGRL